MRAPPKLIPIFKKETASKLLDILPKITEGSLVKKDELAKKVGLRGADNNKPILMQLL